MKNKNMLSMVVVIAGLAAFDAMAKTEVVVGTFTVPNASVEGYLKEADLPTALAEEEAVVKIKAAMYDDMALKANTSDVGALSDTVAGHTTAIAQKLNSSDFDTTLQNNNAFKAKLSSSDLASTMGVTLGANQTIAQKLAADMASAASTAASGAVNNIDAAFLATKGGITTGNLESTLGIDGQEGDSVAAKLQAKVNSAASEAASSAATTAANNAASTAINNLTSAVLADKMGITLGANETLSDKIVTNNNITNILKSSGAMDNVVKTTVDGKIDASVLPTDVATKLSNLGTCVTTVDAETGKEVIDSCTGVLGILASKSGAVSQ